jgi:hypothetical protein
MDFGNSEASYVSGTCNEIPYSNEQGIFAADAVVLASCKRIPIFRGITAAASLKQDAGQRLPRSAVARSSIADDQRVERRRPLSTRMHHQRIHVDLH